MRLQVTAPLTIMAAISLVFSAVAAVALGRGSDTVRWAKEQEMAEVAAQVETTLRQASRNVVAQAELVAGMPDVARAVAERDTAFLRGLMPIYQRQRAKYGIETASFILPPATMLLRLHDLSRAGDDQSANRPLLLVASRLQEPQSGLEITPATSGMRGVAPISHEGRYVGAVEWSVGLFRLAQEIHDVTHAEVTFFLRRNRIEGNRAAEERRIGAMAGLVTTDWELTSGLLQPGDMEEVNGTKLDYRTWRGTDYALAHVPIFDFSGERVGTVVAIREVNEYAHTDRMSRAILIAAVVVGTVLCGGVVLLVVRGRILRPMERLTNRAKSMSEGDFSSAVSDGLHDNEIGVYSRALESLRQSLLRRSLPVKEKTEQTDTEA